MEYTTNYQLPQWVETDRIMMDDFNDLTEKLDEALSEIPGKGNCQIYTTSYVGNGRYGADYQNSLTFPSKPRILMIGGGYGYLFYIYNSTYALFFSDAWSSRTVTWSDNTITWRHEESARKQLNMSSMVYYVVALLDAKE